MSNINFKNISIIGTSHIAEQSVEDIRNFLIKHNPDIIAVELDKDRMISLMSKKEDTKKSGLNLPLLFKVGPFGYIFYLLGHFFQKKLGKIVNLNPGADMKAALDMAKEKKLHIALIDQHIYITLKKLSKAFNIFLLLKIIRDLFLAMFGIGPKLNVKFDLKKVPDDKTIELLIDSVKKSYPEIYNVLIDERNKYMAKRLVVISKKHPDKHIVAIIGAGHKKGMIEDIKNMYDKIEIV